MFLTEGSHTMCKRVVSSSSKASGLMSKFTKKRATCISCKAVLQRDGKFSSVVIVNISFVEEVPTTKCIPSNGGILWFVQLGMRLAYGLVQAINFQFTR